MSAACPFCGGVVIVDRQPDGVTLAHRQPFCGSWLRVCYEGGFSAAEREALDAFVRNFEPGGPIS